MKILTGVLLIIIMCVFCTTAIFSHAVSLEARHIKQNETWTGVINIMNDTIVEENVTLNIKPGTKVIFYVESEERPPRLIIKGSLHAEGIETSAIIFSSSEEALLNPAEENKGLFDKMISFIAKKKAKQIKFWGGIHFENVEDNNSIIAYCIIDRAKDGVVCNNSSPQIKNSTLQNCKESGIRCNLKSNSVISFNIFKNNSLSGIYCHQESAPEILSNLFQELPAGIYCYQASPKIITKNNFKNNKIGIFCRFPGASPKIVENKFNNNENGIYCEQIASPKIYNNSFDDNEKAVYLQRLSNPGIEKNTFTKNTFGVYCFQNSSPVIYHNKFISNKTGIYLHYASYPTINDNFLDESNEFAIKVGKQSYKLYQELKSNSNSSSETAIGIGKFAPKNPGKNSKKPEFLKQKDFAGIESMINARGNFWGKNMTQEMITKGENTNITSIWDGYDEPEFEFEGKKYPQDKVDYKEWLLKWE